MSTGLRGIDLFLAGWIFVAGLVMRWNARKTLDAQKHPTNGTPRSIHEVTP